ncbi:penicillin acylase family protein [uncultured Reyranella sp.]|uniref:penicillin acylase family protein n=1 Tax=uncultured Reyranella sp. TaxID=735512 RepID=UPI0025F8A478|nr:penicillin acylase family protein [uncultured Reyranella sp.]
MRLLVRVAAVLGKVLAGTALALAVFLTGTYFHVHGALPSYSGTMDVAGLKAPVEILRDKNAVPHIIAGSIDDASFALGYVHAQDRFWQMELMRRIGQGRLAELVPPALVGNGLVDSDRTMRGLGVYRRASESVNALSPAMRARLDAYAAGVNAWLSDDDQQFGLELTLIKLLSAGGYRPEPWRPADSLVWAKLMALGLDGNWRAELLRLRLSQKIGEDGVKFLIEPSGDSKDSTLSMVMAAVKDIDLDRIFRGTDNEVTRKREASNEWVLSGAHAVSGRPLLANDPHLGFSFPGVWYLARLIGPGFDIRGATSPGSPAVVLGHNGIIGWGFTTTNLDSQDIFVERVDPTDPNRYITPDGARPFAVREETIKVAWGDPITMRVRETRHGPVIDDFVRHGENLTPQGHVLALQATALDGADTSAEGFARVGSAQNWDEFLSAARRIVSPMQNMVYADTSGNIGLISPARVPIRRKGDGSMPVPGWTSEYDWAGFVPFEELPRVYNPVGGVIVNANGRLVPDDYRHFISKDWAEPYRQRRAAELLGEVERHPVYGMIVMQADNLTLDAAEMLPYLLKGAARNTRAAQARDLLSRWNMFMLASRPEPLIYNAWITELQRGLLADELGEDLFNSIAVPNVPLMIRILRDKPGWCDDGGTKPAESCEDAIALALDRALDWIARRQGPDMTKWQWGREHFAVHRHPLFDGVPLLRDIASVRYPSDGGNQTLNRASPSFRGNRPFDAVHGAGYRGIYDFSDLENSRFATPLGQSGNMLSPWARNFVQPWQKLAYINIGGTRAETARSAVGTITLNPATR